MIDCLDGEDERLCDCPLDRFKCHTGTCIPRNYVCDGHPQCPDLSDEWGCYKIENINIIVNGNQERIEDVSKESSQTEEKAILNIKRNDGKYSFVCGDNWSTYYSDLVCSKLGFADSLEWSELYLSKPDKNMSLLNIAPYTDRNFLANLKDADSCEKGIISLKCNEYECGPPSSTLRIVGGKIADQSQWSHVALAVSDALQCTASIIAPQWALASYSCISGKTEFFNTRKEDVVWTLHAGSSLFNDSQAERITVERLIPYPQAKFKHFLYAGNAVLLRLQKPLTFSNTISSVCLSAENTIPDTSSHECMTAGWGVSKPGESHLQQNLNYLSTPIVPIAECNSTRQFAGSLADDSICTQHIGTSATTCYNDEGAPLMCYSEKTSHWTLQGILSYHGNCGRRPQPAVYSSMSHELLNWIVQTVGNSLMVRKS